MGQIYYLFALLQLFGAKNARKYKKAALMCTRQKAASLIASKVSPTLRCVGDR